MLLVLLTALPIFATIALGALAARRGWLPAEAVSGLNAFAFLLAMPALNVRLVASQPIAELMAWPFLAAVTIGALALFGATVLVSLAFERRGIGVAASRAQGATIGNLGFLGVPLLLAFLGERAAAAIAMCFLVDLLIVIPLAIALMSLARDGGETASARALALVKGAVLNPFLLSVVLGLTIAALEIRLPQPVDRFLAFLGAAAGPTALVALGISLAGRALGDRLAPVAALAVAKLVAYPLILYVLTAHVFGLSPLLVAAAVLFGALPIAGNVHVLALRYGADPDPIAGAILVTTLLAALTFPATAWMLGL